MLKRLDRDSIKYFAVIPMIIGHIFTNFLTSPMISSMPGFAKLFLFSMQFVAPPIFFFFISEGYKYSKSKHRYAVRLLAVAIVTQITYTLAYEKTLLTTSLFLRWNVFLALLLGLLMICVWDSGWKTIWRVLLCGAILAVSFVLSCDWMIFGPLIILGFYVFRDKTFIRFVWFSANILLTLISSGGWRIAGIFKLNSFAMLFFLFLGYIIVYYFYNGKKGKHPVFSKWFFYVVYPLHYLVIFLLYNL